MTEPEAHRVWQQVMEEVWDHQISVVFYRSRGQMVRKVSQHISSMMELVQGEVSDEVWSHVPDALEPERFLG